MAADELEEGGQRAAFAVERDGRILERRRDRVADLCRHVADKRLEHGLLAVEIGVEGAERDAGAAGDPDDRGVRKALVAELVERGVEDLAKRPLSTRGPRRFALACGA